jgi:hypothetical protein
MVAQDVLILASVSGGASREVGRLDREGLWKWK